MSATFDAQLAAASDAARAAWAVAKRHRVSRYVTVAGRGGDSYYCTTCGRIGSYPDSAHRHLEAKLLEEL